MFENYRAVIDGPLSIRTFPDGDEIVVVLVGELDRSNVSSAASVIDGVVPRGDGPLVIDLQELEFLDSSGVALLSRLHGAKRSRDRMRVVPSRSLGVSRILARTGLDTMLTVTSGTERLQPSPRRLPVAAGERG
jgi:anti-sigma B factor antagonist